MMDGIRFQVLIWKFIIKWFSLTYQTQVPLILLWETSLRHLKAVKFREVLVELALIDSNKYLIGKFLTKDLSRKIISSDLWWIISGGFSFIKAINLPQG